VLDVPDPAEVHIGMKFRVEATSGVPHAKPVQEDA
jgi:hypothetical protein